jgi:hypothetical protein
MKLKGININRLTLKKILKNFFFLLISVFLACLFYSFYLQADFKGLLERGIEKNESLRYDVFEKIAFCGDCGNCSFEQKSEYDTLWLETAAYDFDIKYIRQLMNEGYPLLSLRLIYTYNKRFASFEIRRTITYAMDRCIGSMGFAVDKIGTEGYMKNLKDKFDTWEIANPNANHEWGVFRDSSQYKEFLSYFFSEIEKDSSRNLNEAYERILNTPRLRENIYEDNLIFCYSIDLYREMAVDAYSNYKWNKENGNYIGAIYDANIIYEIDERLETLKKIGITDYINEYGTIFEWRVFFLMEEIALISLLTIIVFLSISFFKKILIKKKNE